MTKLIISMVKRPSGATDSYSPGKEILLFYEIRRFIIVFTTTPAGLSGAS
jgi:hypothetical protein